MKEKITKSDKLLKIAYKNWLKLREKSSDGWDGKLCYCGHTYRCACDDPDFETFKDSIERGTIILGDIYNGWKSKK